MDDCKVNLVGGVVLIRTSGDQTLQFIKPLCLSTGRSPKVIVSVVHLNPVWVSVRV